MSLNIKDKQTVVIEINKIAKVAISAVVVNFCGLNADKMTELRKYGRKANVYIRVVRNTLLCRAIKGTAFECLQNTFTGPTLIAFSMKYPSTAARLFKEFTKTNTELEIKAAAFEGKFIPLQHIDDLATLPTYEEAVSRLITTIMSISIHKLFFILITIRNIKK